jgi:hypothetical protein
MKALIDADIIVYEAGSAADTTYYTVDDKEFPLISDARTYVEETYGIPRTGKHADGDKNIKHQDRFIEFHRDGAPVEYSLSNCRQIISNIMQSTGAKTGTLYLTSDDHSNYRYERATIKPYKGTRSSTGKPFWYKEIRDYLVTKWGAIVVYGREADDALGCAQMEAWDEDWAGNPDDTIICTKDKDLDMIPGWHYNWQTDNAYKISDEQGWRNFYYQLLIGDATDNIAGCPGVGKKNAEAVAIKAGAFPFDRAEFETVIFDMYKSKYANINDPMAWEAMRENADLLWIQREEGVLWEPVIEAPVSEGEGTEVAAVGDEETDSEIQLA